MNKRQKKKQEKMRTKRMLKRYPFLRGSLCEYDSLYPGWDPDFTKATSEEKERMDAADKELREGVYFTEGEVWEEVKR